ncbi:MAG TPA: hypothetical protein VFX30_11580, partial [bacterium]|nr:hypothetical protein [bacterium]
MMVPSLRSAVQPVLVSGLEAQYMASVRANFHGSEFLLDAGRDRIASLLDRNATVSEVGDAHFLGLAEHYLAGHGAPVRPAETPSVFTPFGEIPSGEFDWVKKANPVRRFQGADAEALVGRFRRTPETFHVLETEGCRATMPWDVAGPAFLHLSQRGLQLYHRDEIGNFRSRLPSLTFWEGLLDYCFGEAGARLCLASGEVPEKDYNELHRLNYHPVGLSFEAEYLEDVYVHPFLFATHDAFFHALNWSLQVAPWRRSAGAVFYKVLRETAPDMFYGPYADCLEWALDPEVSKHDTVMAAITSTLGVFQHTWSRLGEDKTP